METETLRFLLPHTRTVSPSLKETGTSDVSQAADDIVGSMSQKDEGRKLF